MARCATALSGNSMNHICSLFSEHIFVQSLYIPRFVLLGTPSKLLTTLNSGSSKQ